MSNPFPFARQFALDIKAAEERRRAALARVASPTLATLEAVDAAFNADLDAARGRLFTITETAAYRIEEPST